MTGKSTIYLVRHGQCKANLENMNLPHELDVITEKGKLQAALLGEDLRNVRFTKAYASTYSRAHDTASEILSKNTCQKPELSLDERIRERELGDFENRPMGDLFTALFAAAREKGTKMIDFEVPGGEPVANLEGRISSFLEQLLEDVRRSGEPQTVLIVTHGVVIMRMMLKLRAWSKDESRALTLKSWELSTATIPIQNTGYHLFTVATPSSSNGNQTVIEFQKLHAADHLQELKSKELHPPPNEKTHDQIAASFKELVDEQCTTH